MKSRGKRQSHDTDKGERTVCLQRQINFRRSVKDTLEDEALFYSIMAQLKHWLGRCERPTIPNKCYLECFTFITMSFRIFLVPLRPIRYNGIVR